MKMSRSPMPGRLPRGSLQLRLEPRQRREALLERRVVGEEVHHRVLRAGGDDEKRAHALGAAQVVLRYAIHLAGDLDERRGERAGPAGEDRRAAVGGELAV